MKKYVLGLAFDMVGSRVVLIKKNRSDWQKGRFNGVGGKVQAGEHLLKTMIREFEEETGLKTSSEYWKRKIVMTKNNYEVHIFKAYLTSQELKEIRTTTDEEVFIKDTHLLNEAIPNLRWIIPLILDVNVESARIYQD